MVIENGERVLLMYEVRLTITINLNYYCNATPGY